MAYILLVMAMESGRELSREVNPNPRTYHQGHSFQPPQPQRTVAGACLCCVHHFIERPKFITTFPHPLTASSPYHPRVGCAMCLLLLLVLSPEPPPKTGMLHAGPER